MSKDQSQQVRKVTPYKKGGRRQSPFSEMAFHFSGTALDVAIQQRTQEAEAAASEPVVEVNGQDKPVISTLLAEKEEFDQAISPDRSDRSPASTAPVLSERENYPLTIMRREEEQQPPPARQQLLARDKNQALIKLRSSRKLAIKKLAARSATKGGPDLQAFVERWKPFLTDTQIKICVYIYNNSIAVDQDYCFTSIAKLVSTVEKTARQVITVINQLLDWELIIKGDTIASAPRGGRGTYYKINPDKL